jgi:hypothetical protein
MNIEKAKPIEMALKTGNYEYRGRFLSHGEGLVG